MHVTLVHVWVLHEHVPDFLEATRLNHEASIQEAGNRRFDILQDAQVPDKFILYEAYDSPESAAAHKLTPHYLAWRERVAPMMARPREGQPCLGLYPAG